MDAVWLEAQQFESLTMSNKDFNKSYHFQVDRNDFREGYLDVDIINKIHNNLDAHDVLDKEFEKLKEDRQILHSEIFPQGKDTWPLPCNLKRLIWNAQKQFKVNLRQPTNLHPVTVVEEYNYSVTSFASSQELKMCLRTMQHWNVKSCCSMCSDLRPEIAKRGRN
jgi:DNA-directed RNA polymerase II subunit RPB1